MRLPAPFIQLPLRFDADRLAREIDALGDGPWRPHPQGYAGNTMVPLVAVGGDAANETFNGPMLPTPELARCPYIVQVMESLGAVVGRSRLMRLSGHAEVTRHVDHGYYWVERVRVHVPIVTQPTVRFECGDAVVNMARGECWIFDSWRQHRVLNDAEESRVHLVVDTVGSGAFWDLVARGRAWGVEADATWAPDLVAPVDGARDPSALPLERVNMPEVMSPWEMQAHFDLLFGDALPHPQLAFVQAAAAGLLRQWRGLWARFGTAPDGWPHYGAAMEHFLGAVRAPAQTIGLRNETGWFSGMMAMVGRPALRAAQGAARGGGRLPMAVMGPPAGTGRAAR